MSLSMDIARFQVYGDEELNLIVPNDLENQDDEFIYDEKLYQQEQPSNGGHFQQEELQGLDPKYQILLIFQSYKDEKVFFKNQEYFKKH